MDMSNVKYDICLTYLFNLAINYLLVKKTSKIFQISKNLNTVYWVIFALCYFRPSTLAIGFAPS